MTTHSLPAADDSAATPDIGEFPFPLTSGTKESEYLVWLRNHSNYMAVRGFLDYVRSAGALLRGIVINFLIFVPFLLLASLVLAYAHHWMLRNPFLITRWTLAISAACILLFPIAVQLFRLWHYKKSLQTGSDSSVKKRDFYERVFGGLLLLVLAVTILESLPWLVEFVDDRVRRGTLGWQGGFATLGSALTILSASAKLLSSVRGATRKLAIALIGLLGLLVPLSVILLASGYLLFGFPPSPFAIIMPVIAAIGIVVVIVAAISIGAYTRSLKRKELVFGTALLVAGLALGILGIPTAATIANNTEERASETLGAFTRPVTRVANVLDEIKKPGDLDPELEVVLRNIAIANAEWKKTRMQLRTVQATTKPDFWEPVQKAIDSKAFDWAHIARSLASSYRKLPDYFENKQSLWEQNKIKYYSRERQLIPLVDTLLSQPKASLAMLRPAIFDSARGKLAAGIDMQPGCFNPDPGAALSDEEKQGVLKSCNTDKLLTLTRSDPEKRRISEACDVDMLLALALDQGTAAAMTLDARNKLRILDETRSKRLSPCQTARIIADQDSFAANDLAAKLAYGEYASLEAITAGSLKEELTNTTFTSKAIFVLILAVVIGFGSWLTVDVNVTSIHALYRDRLAAAFLIGQNSEGNVDIEEDIDLHAICLYEAGSVAPYHLINVALNLQGSDDIGIRDRKSDFFIFSRRFIGGERTGYCRSEIMEQVFPQMSLGSAMAISAAAASPNMGRGTSPLLVAFMTLLNIRLGYWIPNPGLLEESARNKGRRRRCFPQGEPPGVDFAEVFAQESREIEGRWHQVYAERPRLVSRIPSVEHGLVGIAFSGGGIRSAAINLGITQALHQRGVFDHVDYMSTVSGGGYLGSSISTLMRSRDFANKKPLHEQRSPQPKSKITENGVVECSVDTPRETAANSPGVQNGSSCDYRLDSIGDRFRWQVRPNALLREIFSRLDERHRWVNLSDGGHIENLATIELLRRRCKYIIIGDGEADSCLHFGGLANLMRAARTDLQVKIEIDLDAIRLRTVSEGPATNATAVSGSHWAIGKITYPATNGKAETGYLLYLKSSFTGDEDETIREYRHRNPTFPHQTTADQFFDEGQFEAYRSLGLHIAGLALDGKHMTEPAGHYLDEGSEDSEIRMSYEDLEHWFKMLWEKQLPTQPAGPA